MNEGLVFKIGADIGDLEKGISESQKQLQKFGQSIKSATGEPVKAAVDNLNALDKSIIKTGKDLGSLKPESVSGANALNSLSQVARDLPFGFIAIQNNLPQVIDSFSSLTKKAGGVTGAISSITETITGPEGISFAIGIAITGLTVLVQKYGSLGKAFDNFFGDVETATADQILFNESVAKAAGGLENEKNKIDILVKTLTDLKQPQKDRLSAYNELKKISPDIVAGIDAENISSSKSINILNAQAQIRKNLLQLKITESGINQVLSQNAADLSIANVNLAKARKDANDALIAFNASQKQTNTLALQAQQGQSAEAITLDYKRIALKEAKKTVEDLISTQKQYLSQLDPIVNKISVTNSEIDKKIAKDKEQAKATKKVTDKTKEYRYELETIRDIRLSPEQLNVQSNIDKLQELANVVLNVTATEKKRAEALKQLQAIDPKLFQGLTTQKGSYEALKAAIDVLNEGYILELDYYNRIAKSEPVVDKFALANQGLKEFNQNLFNTIQVYDRETAKLKPIGVTVTQTQGKLTPTPEAPIVAPALPSGISDTIDKFAADTNKAKLALDDFKKQANLTAAYNLINDTFFSPLQDLFSTFLSTGKLAFADFGKAVIKAIQQIVAKILATGVIALIGTLLTGGFSAGAGGFAGGIKKVGELIAGSLGFGGKVAAPQFAGVGGGTMGMSGSVNVVLRGSDLVGSINRTNATISRVG